MSNNWKLDEIKDQISVEGKNYQVLRFDKLPSRLPMAQLPVSIRILLENVLRQHVQGIAGREAVDRVLAWDPANANPPEIPYLPSRVLMQDFTGVPAVVDLAAMRNTLKEWGGDPNAVNPVIPVDLVIDHSVQMDITASPDGLAANAEIEYRRNGERYRFLKWGQQAFQNFRVVPPAMGIIHQINLEYLAPVVGIDQTGFAFPDTLVGTDSHTTMINGLGVLGWGVGGIEAEAAMLGQPLPMLLPPVVGFRLTGKLAPATTATDLVLMVTEKLRQAGVVGKIVEFFGDGLQTLSLADRATIANMAPEYGATAGFFPVDEVTLQYLRLTGRDEALVQRVEAYCHRVGLFHQADTESAVYSQELCMDLGTVEASLAGPKRPQDRVALPAVGSEFKRLLTAPVAERGFALTEDKLAASATCQLNNQTSELHHGSVVIASITSCTNTSNPAVMLGAGMVAEKAVARGLKVPASVRTSFAPGSRVVADYLAAAGVVPALEELGFHIVGYGCATCIGNSGPLPEPVETAIKEGNLVAASVLSGNRNFEGRIHPATRANYLASPPLVVAFALAGRMDIDLSSEPLGTDQDGNPVYLKDIWPDDAELAQRMAEAVRAEMFRERYGHVFEGDELWQALAAPAGDMYLWEEDSTYIRRPSFLEGLPRHPVAPGAIRGARVLGLFGDSVTTDHISPAGTIPPGSPAERYLFEQGVQRVDFNSFGSRRGNHEVMMRGTFGNIRLKNRLVGSKEGNLTRVLPDGTEMSMFDGAEVYQQRQIPAIILAGREYGTGSSRDWAAKGPLLQGIRAVIAESYERIHRSNLAGMGILPLQFIAGENVSSLGLTGEETYDIGGLEKLQSGQQIEVKATASGGQIKVFKTLVRLDTALEVQYFEHGGILPYVMRGFMK